MANKSLNFKFLKSTSWQHGKLGVSVENTFKMTYVDPEA